MKLWMRKLGLGALALSLAVAVGGCDDGGGASLIKIYFGIVGDGDCSGVLVTVDLDDADAEIDLNDEGIANCVLDRELDRAGCVSDFDVEGGELLATITGCTIPEISALFSCLFESGVNIDALSDYTTATCECAGDICDEEPPVCIDRNPDPQSCEDCSDGIDNDGNGLVDCDDPICEHEAPCDGGNTTTTSTTTTISDTTTTLPPTTTTLLPTTTTALPPTTTSITLPPPFECNVIFKLDSDQTFGSLQVDVDYSNLPGRPIGDGAGVDCASLALNNDDPAEQVTLIANNKVNQQIITLGFLLPNPFKAGFQGRQNLAECRFQSAAPCEKDDFVLSCQDASDDSTPGAQIPCDQVDVSVGLIKVTQPGSTTLPPTTTTLAPTTTTLPVSETTTTLGGGGDTTTTTNPSDTTTTTQPAPTTTVPGDTTTTTNPGTAQEVVFTLNDVREFGSLQFDVNFGSADSGVTIGTCGSIIAGAVFIPNPDNGTRIITVGGFDTNPFDPGFTGVKDLAACQIATGSPSAGNFLITVTSATDPTGNDYATNSVSVTPSIAPAP